MAKHGRSADLRKQKAGRGLRKSGHWSIGAHSHPHYEVLYVTEGGQRVRYGDQWYEARVGDLLIYEPGHIHEEHSLNEDFSIYWVRFSKADVKSCGVPFPRLDGPLVPMGERHQDMIMLFERYCGEFHRPGSSHDALIRSYLTQFIVMVDRQLNGHDIPRWSGVSDDPRARLYKVLEKIHSSIGNHMDLQDLAVAANMSVSHFSRLFKDEFGESPKHYLIRQRMEKAKELLSESDDSAQDIARALGYDNVYFFYRQFKKYTGVTTTDYREASAE